jgi:uncharacterized protein (TIGR02145 family)
MNGSEKENAQGIAPMGWHIPSIADWEELVRYLDGEEKVAEQITYSLCDVKQFMDIGEDSQSS